MRKTGASKAGLLDQGKARQNWQQPTTGGAKIECIGGLQAGSWAVASAACWLPGALGGQGGSRSSLAPGGLVQHEGRSRAARFAGCSSAAGTGACCRRLLKRQQPLHSGQEWTSRGKQVRQHMCGLG